MASAFGKVVIAGCMRDCAAALPDVFRNIEALAGLYREAAFVFVENDARDQTKAMAQTWCAARTSATLLDLDGLSQTQPVRTLRLETTRNETLARVKSRFITSSDPDRLR